MVGIQKKKEADNSITFLGEEVIKTRQLTSLQNVLKSIRCFKKYTNNSNYYLFTMY